MGIGSGMRGREGIRSRRGEEDGDRVSTLGCSTEESVIDEAVAPVEEAVLEAVRAVVYWAEGIADAVAPMVELIAGVERSLGGVGRPEAVEEEEEERKKSVTVFLFHVGNGMANGV